jgi:hypothetical protein
MNQKALISLLALTFGLLSGCNNKPEGTGPRLADVSQFAIIGDTARKVKIAIVSKTVVPDISLIDLETTATMPAELTAATGIDALVHAIEACVSNASSPVTDLNALAAIRKLNQELELRVKERTTALEAQKEELARMNKLFVGRELRMAELKKHIKALGAELNETETSSS